jgi:aspartate aminotransferase-like enzyme
MSYRLRLPGPTTVPDRVLRAVGTPMVDHRGPEFRKLFARITERIQPILGTTNPVLFFASSGTGVMEASLANTIAPGEPVLVCVNDQFSERFALIAKALGAHVDILDVEWGRGVDPADVARRIEAADYRAVLVVHNASSTGAVSDIAGIGKVVRDTSTLLIVDSVSGLGGIEMRQDEWGVDILISASQKALMCPPGMGIASVSPKARKLVSRDSGMPRFYWDFREAIESAEESVTPYTPPLSLMFGLRESLDMIHEEGLPQVLDRHRRLSGMLRTGCNALGLATFPQGDVLSNTVVVVEVPGDLDGGQIVRQMYARHETAIAGSRNKLKGRVIRLGTMGYFSEQDIRTDLEFLSETMAYLRSSVGTHAG